MVRSAFGLAAFLAPGAFFVAFLVGLRRAFGGFGFRYGVAFDCVADHSFSLPRRLRSCWRVQPDYVGGRAIGGLVSFL